MATQRRNKSRQRGGKVFATKENERRARLASPQKPGESPFNYAGRLAQIELERQAVEKARQEVEKKLKPLTYNDDHNLVPAANNLVPTKLVTPNARSRASTVLNDPRSRASSNASNASNASTSNNPNSRTVSLGGKRRKINNRTKRLRRRS